MQQQGMDQNGSQYNQQQQYGQQNQYGNNGMQMQGMNGVQMQGMDQNGGHSSGQLDNGEGRNSSPPRAKQRQPYEAKRKTHAEERSVENGDNKVVDGGLRHENSAVNYPDNLNISSDEDMDSEKQITAPEAQPEKPNYANSVEEQDVPVEESELPEEAFEIRNDRKNVPKRAASSGRKTRSSFDNKNAVKAGKSSTTKTPKEEKSKKNTPSKQTKQSNFSNIRKKIPQGLPKDNNRAKSIITEPVNDEELKHSYENSPEMKTPQNVTAVTEQRQSPSVSEDSWDAEFITTGDKGADESSFNEFVYDLEGYDDKQALLAADKDDTLHSWDY
jgi:hypothetical protein